MSPENGAPLSPSIGVTSIDSHAAASTATSDAGAPATASQPVLALMAPAAAVVSSVVVVGASTASSGAPPAAEASTASIGAPTVTSALASVTRLLTSATEVAEETLDAGPLTQAQKQQIVAAASEPADTPLNI